MEEQKNPTELNHQPVSTYSPKPAPSGSPQLMPPKQRRSKKALAVSVIAALLIGILIAGGLAGAYLVGKSESSGNLEESRQTVVQEGEVISDVAQKAGKSVVSIVTEQESVTSLSGRTRTSRAAGTGLIIDTNGLILTNKHVVPDGVSSVQVFTSDGTKYDNATVIGRDPLNDIAVIKVTNPKNFVVASLGDSDSVRTGQKVIAIGNALGQFQNTVTSGIISGMGRPVEAGSSDGGYSEQLSNLFQTDAAINSGNSGGPLLNFNGEVIGINTAVAADAQNIGFAIPINETKGIIDSVKTTGKVSRPYIGVQYVMLTADSAKELKLSVSKGAYISTDAGSVVTGSPAAKAGLKSGDVITKVNSIELNDTTSLASAVGRSKVGDTVELTVIRSGKEQKIKVTLAEAPAS